MPIHKQIWTSKATIEVLPDIGGANIVYGGKVESGWETMERTTSPSSLVAGVSGGSGGKSGIIQSVRSECMPQYKLGSAVVWETTVQMLNPS